MLGLRLPSISNNAFHMKKKKITSSEIKPFYVQKLITRNTLEKPFDNEQNPVYGNYKSHHFRSSFVGIDEKLRIENPEKDKYLSMPRHVAMIVDGNKRWAEAKGMPTQYGHYMGFQKLKEQISWCRRLGIQIFTNYLFSSENWSRPKEEVDFIMKALEEMVRYHVMESTKRHDLRFSVIGDRSRLPTSLQSAISSVEDSSKSNKGMHLVFAISYGGRDEIIEAVKKISENIKDGKLRAEDINKEVFEQHLETTMLPEPDMLIRTSGELRISNFMLWQLAYAELYFCDKLFPDLNEHDFIEAIGSFQKRKRRFGGRNLEEEMQVRI